MILTLKTDFKDFKRISSSEEGRGVAQATLVRKGSEPLLVDLDYFDCTSVRRSNPDRKQPSVKVPRESAIAFLPKVTPSTVAPTPVVFFYSTYTL